MLDLATGLEWSPSAFVDTTLGCGTQEYLDWQEALNYVACLNTHNYLGYGDWRLPNINELVTLLHFGVANPGAWLESRGFHASGSWPWSSTTYSLGSGSALFVNFPAGSTTFTQKSSDYLDVWPVRAHFEVDGAVARTGQTACYDINGATIDCTGTGQDGLEQRGTPWPSPRFTNVDGTTPLSGSVIFDQLTGLTWPRNPGAATSCGEPAGLNWLQALSFVACLNVQGYAGYTDWRLPQPHELRSLVNFNEPDSSVWLNGEGFVGLQWSSCWSSTSVIRSPNEAWSVALPVGSLDAVFTKDRQDVSTVWVRGGR